MMERAVEEMAPEAKEKEVGAARARAAGEVMGVAVVAAAVMAEAKEEVEPAMVARAAAKGAETVVVGTMGQEAEVRVMAAEVAQMSNHAPSPPRS